MKRLDRKPMVESAAGSIDRLKSPFNWTAKFGSRYLDLQFLENQPDGRKLVESLAEWQQHKRGAYGIAITVRRYLRYTVSNRMLVGALSLLSYRSNLEADASLAPGTRRGYYSASAAFVSFLVLNGSLSIDQIPTGLKGVRTTPKPTFAEKANARASIQASPEYSAWVSGTAELYYLDASTREVLAVNDGWMNLIEHCAAKTVLAQLDDWRYAQRVIIESNQYSAAEGWASKRSIPNALALLHKTFGRLIPPTRSWPAGVADYCKVRRWSPDRVKAAFFPTIKSLDAFLVLALSNRQLMPNVDSVLYYAFVGCVTETEDSSNVRVRFGKFRGTGVDCTIEKRSALAQGLSALQAIVDQTLKDHPGNIDDITKDGGIPIFLHFLGRGLPTGVRRIDPSMAAHMVRRFIRKTALNKPVLNPLVGRITGEHFRTTHLLSRRLRGESLFAIQEKAGHRHPSTTAGYLKRAEVESTADRRYSDFQQYLISEARARSMRRLGNGFHCASNTAEQEGCFRIDLCGAGASGCDARHIVLESPSIVAEWLAWAEHIRSASEYLKAHRPERWENIWRPRLIEYEVLIESVSFGMRAKASKLIPNIQLLPLE